MDNLDHSSFIHPSFTFHSSFIHLSSIFHSPFIVHHSSFIIHHSLSSINIPTHQFSESIKYIPSHCFHLIINHKIFYHIAYDVFCSILSYPITRNCHITHYITHIIIHHKNLIMLSYYHIHLILIITLTWICHHSTFIIHHS
jgi:hypothetical protein